MTEQTMVTLEIIAQITSEQHFNDLVNTFAVIRGVERVKVARSSAIEKHTTEIWATLEVALSGKDEASLRRLYTKVSKRANEPPFRLTGRGCILNEIYD